MLGLGRPVFRPNPEDSSSSADMITFPVGVRASRASAQSLARPTAFSAASPQVFSYEVFHRVIPRVHGVGFERQGRENRLLWSDRTHPGTLERRHTPKGGHLLNRNSSTGKGSSRNRGLPDSPRSACLNRGRRAATPVPGPDTNLREAHEYLGGKPPGFLRCSSTFTGSEFAAAWCERPVPSCEISSGPRLFPLTGPKTCVNCAEPTAVPDIPPRVVYTMLSSECSSSVVQLMDQKHLEGSRVSHRRLSHQVSFPTREIL